MKINSIFLIVPKLIEQPTWGGRYILQLKNWHRFKIYKNLLIGQSYELSSNTKLRCDLNTTNDKSFIGELGYGMKPNKIYYYGNKNKLVDIKTLIKINPKSILGEKALKKHGTSIKLLIKFTQATGNSFQIHVKEKDSNKKWHYKPESWYYFKPGLMTLGVKKNIKWQDYFECCLDIEKKMKKLSRLVKLKKTNINLARLKAKKIVKRLNPWQYVNYVKVKENELIDLSCGGLHHSWEENDKKYPQGNILYELQLDVMDPVSTIRSFDKGKIKNNGSIRKLNINDYFNYIDRSKINNNPNSHILKENCLFSSNKIKVDRLLKTSNYCLDKISLKKEYSGEYTNLKESFHHLFIKKGKVLIANKNQKILMGRGHSCFMPYAVGDYRLINKNTTKSEILKTYIE